MSEKDKAKHAQEEARRIRKKEIADAQARTTRLLEQARREVLADVADTDWERYAVPRLTAAIDRQLEQWRRDMAEGLQREMSSLWALGDDTMAATVGAMGIELGLPEIPTSLLLAMQEKAGQRIGHLMNFAKDQVDREIASLLLAGKPREEAIAAIGRQLAKATRPGFQPAGIFGSVNARARFIVQQELGTVFSTAQDLRRAQVTKYVPSLRKVWVHDGHPLKPRPEHVAMHGQARDQDDEFSNGLLFPRDPKGEIEETAGCTCDVFLWRSEYGSKDEFIGPATGAMEEAA